MIGRGRFDIPFARDGSVRFLPWIVALMVYLAGIALAGMLLLDAALGDWNRGLNGVMTVELPPAANEQDGAAEIKLVLAVLDATPGVTHAAQLPREQVAKLVEPWLGGGEAVGQLALPRLIDVKIDPVNRPDFDDLRANLAKASPGAMLDDARQRFDRLFDLGRSVEITAAAILLLIGAAAVMTTMFTTRAGLAVHQNVIEILHILGAQDSYIARQFARQSLALGWRGGVMGWALAVVTLLLLGQAAEHAAVFGPSLRLVPSIVLRWWQWAALALLPVAAAAISYFTALATVRRALARMP
ncbi:MAG TPA: cell division protein [Stellaceae bacterium]|nr:cell division protein [Stellaceae bacterium]